ncbi:MAG: hypothetical protein HYV09_16355 [Deltaproteobacteria bacterium]|nr:hypothetical protein [Deltaproteobacteria bacterium]
MLEKRAWWCVVIAVVALAGCGDDEGSSTPATDSGVSTDGSGTDTAGADTGASGDAAGETGETAPDAADDAADDAPAAPTCAAYCDAVMTTCTGTKNTQYIDAARCLSMCAKMAVGGASDMSGDTVGCRLNHARLAKSGGTDLHCPHAGATGGTVCGPKRCDAFCKLAMAQCTSGAPFTSEADCKSKCPEAEFSATAAASELDQTRQTFNCMQYHLQAAYQSAAAATTHCPHLTLTSGPCGPT